MLDSVLIVLVTAVAAVLRVIGIGEPGNLVFDEHYATDACLFVLDASNCPTAVEMGFVHPPLAKWLIGAGIRVFGFTPTAWRLAPLVAGTLSVAVLYLLERRLAGSTLAASLAAALLAFDFLHFIMSRTAMLDIFVVLFGLLSFLCLAYDRDRHEGTNRLLERRWLLAAGIAGGAAMASKWSGVYLFVGVAMLAISNAAAGAGDGPSRYWKVARQDGAILLTCLVALPLLIYVVSHAGRLHGTVLTWPWTEGSWARAFVARHQEMFEHHTGALYTHPYMSPAWSWPLIKRPVLFYFRDAGAGFREILAMGNPLVWWPALLALGAIAWRLLRRRALHAEAMVVTGFAAAYLPWFVITRQEAFLYYLLPAVPFMYLGLACTVTMMPRSVRAASAVGLVVASIGMFSFFWPVLVGKPLSYEQWERRMLFSNCGPISPKTRKQPVIRPQPPPAGWCWV